jgi:hypothetical protein
MAKIQCVGWFERVTKINNQAYFLIEADDNNSRYKGEPLKFLVNADEYSEFSTFKRCDTLLLEGEIISQSNQGIFLDNIEYRGYDNE